MDTNQPLNPIFQPNPSTFDAPTAAVPMVASPSFQAEVAFQQAAPVQVAAPAPAPTAAPAPAPVVKPLNFELRHQYSAGEIVFNPDLPNVPYPSASRKATLESLSKAPHINIQGKKVDELAVVIRDGLGSIPLGNDMDETRGRDGADFRQEVDVNGQKLQGFAPRFTQREGTKYVGEAARNLIRSELGLGTVFSYPLWHSGFWITVRTPSEGDLITLHRELAQEKSTLGRSTYGVLFSQMTGYTTKIMVDFIERHLHSTSLALPEGKRVTDFLKAADYQVLVWGLTCATWPNGYQIQRACITDPEKCNYVVSERVNLSRLLWTDTTSLTERQRVHMLSRQKGTMTVEQVALYCSEFLRGKNAQVKLSDRVSMVLKMPSMVEYTDASYEWIGKLEEQQTRAMSMREDERNDFLLQHAQAQSMRQYSHFVHSIIVGDNEVDDPETLPHILADISADDDLREAFMEKVQVYQNESLVAFVGIPNYKCPACGTLQLPTAVEGQDREIIALDVTQTFFTLLMQKLASIQAR